MNSHILEWNKILDTSWSHRFGVPGHGYPPEEWEWEEIGPPESYESLAKVISYLLDTGNPALCCTDLELTLKELGGVLAIIFEALNKLSGCSSTLFISSQIALNHLRAMANVLIVWLSFIDPDEISLRLSKRELSLLIVALGMVQSQWLSIGYETLPMEKAINNAVQLFLSTTEPEEKTGFGGEILSE